MRKNIRRKINSALCAASFLSFSNTFSLPLINSAISQLQTLPNFHLNVFASHIHAAREMTLGSKGTVFVGSGDDKVYALQTDDKQTTANNAKVILQHLTQPAGVAFVDGNLFVATQHKIWRYDNIEQHLDNPPAPKLIANLPKINDKSASLFHYLAVGSDNKLYVSIPAPCDHCHAKLPQASIMQIATDGTQQKVYAKGIRASLGFDWLATDQSFWFSTIGETDLGTDKPPATINKAKKVGQDFGFPDFYGQKLTATPHHALLASKKNITPPEMELPAHVEPMGMKFYSGRLFPEQYHNQLLVAEHGPTQPGTNQNGHQIIAITFKDNKPVYYQPFVWGFHTATQNWGDPVDLLNMGDGSVLISDDRANFIYRLSYSAPAPTTKAVAP